MFSTHCLKLTNNIKSNGNFVFNVWNIYFFSKRNRLCEQLEPGSKISLDKQKLGKCVANDQGLKTERTIFFNVSISISEWFLKDYVTPKTGVMAAENSALPSQE